MNSAEVEGNFPQVTLRGPGAPIKVTSDSKPAPYPNTNNTNSGTTERVPLENNNNNNNSHHHLLPVPKTAQHYVDPAATEPITTAYTAHHHNNNNNSNNNNVVRPPAEQILTSSSHGLAPSGPAATTINNNNNNNVKNSINRNNSAERDDSPSLQPYSSKEATTTTTSHNNNNTVDPAAAAPPIKVPKEAVVPAAESSSTGKVEADKVIPKEEDLPRPSTALTVHLVALYKHINGRYCLQRRQESPGPKYNNGFDDRDGHYVVLAGEEILQRYTVQEVLGKGSFGTVVRCYDEKRRETVALKITRQGANFRNQAKLELDILIRLNQNPNLNYLVVKLLKVFEWQGHLVLVFELLSFNLYQLIKCTRYNGVSLDLVRKFAYQLVHTLLALENTQPHPIIHCDLKPENILLRNQNRSGIRLIDFGSACYANKKLHRYIQSRFYRSPEVILYLDYGTAIDRWSLGCVLVELHTGMPLFDGRTEAAQLARFESTLGPIPADMLAASSKTSKFYSGGAQGGYKLKEALLPRRSLETVLGVTTGGPRGSRKGTAGHDVLHYQEFLDFIEKLLRYRPEERISCEDALRHPFLLPLYTAEQTTGDQAKHKAQETAT